MNVTRAQARNAQMTRKALAAHNRRAAVARGLKLPEVTRKTYAGLASKHGGFRRLFNGT